MQRLTHLLSLIAILTSLASCYGPDPRPFAGQGRSLDEPPRYGDTNRYVDPTEPPPGPVVVVPPPPNLDPAVPGADPGLDPGLTLAPPTPGAGATTTVPAPGPGDATTVAPPTVEPPAPPSKPSNIPTARRVPGNPNHVFGISNPKNVISVEGIKPGTIVKDPTTGELFKVPF